MLLRELDTISHKKGISSNKEEPLTEGRRDKRNNKGGMSPRKCISSDKESRRRRIQKRQKKTPKKKTFLWGNANQRDPEGNTTKEERGREKEKETRHNKKKRKNLCERKREYDVTCQIQQQLSIPSLTIGNHSCNPFTFLSECWLWHWLTHLGWR